MDEIKISIDLEEILTDYSLNVIVTFEELLLQFCLTLEVVYVFGSRIVPPLLNLSFAFNKII